MLSHDIENLARALENFDLHNTEENLVFLRMLRVNLHSLADRVHSLEEVPLDDALPYAAPVEAPCLCQ